jgi:hypothetical protein
MKLRTLALLMGFSVSLAMIYSAAPAPPALQGAVPRAAGKPDFSGIWQANNTANWDLQTHQARPMVAQPGLVPNSVVLAAPTGAWLDRLGAGRAWSRGGR